MREESRFLALEVYRDSADPQVKPVGLQVSHQGWPGSGDQLQLDPQGTGQRFGQFDIEADELLCSLEAEGLVVTCGTDAQHTFLQDLVQTVAGLGCSRYRRWGRGDRGDCLATEQQTGEQQRGAKPGSEKRHRGLFFYSGSE
ncbi:hypothetical protein D3C77_426360 [compost metagenome]